MAGSKGRRLARTQTFFFLVVAACVAAIVAIHYVAPRHPAPADPFRRQCTWAYFIALVALTWAFNGPRYRYLEARFAWQFEDCPPTLERMWRDYLYSRRQVAGPFAFVLGTFFATTGLSVLAAWHPALRSFSPLYNLAWWFSVVGLLLFPFSSGALVNQARQHRLQLDREVATGYFKPRALSDLRRTVRVIGSAPAVTIDDARTFTAGGRSWHWENLTQGVMIFGQPGSGKTVCVLNALLDGIIGATARSTLRGSALILDPKGDFAGKIRSVCRKHGRGNDDLLVLDPTRCDSIRWNPLDSNDDELELANVFAGVLEALGMQNTNDTFWIDSAKRFIRHSIALLRLTNPSGEPPSLQQIAELAGGFDAIAARTDLLDPEEDGASGEKTHACLRYFAEWIDLPDETRSGVQAQITNMLDPFTMRPYADVFSGRSTLRIGDMLAKGKILYVNMPMADRPTMAKTVGTFIKLEYFRQVLRSLKEPWKKDRPSFFFCDEFQNYFTPRQGLGDNAFFDKSRQSNHANVIATQNMPALLMQTQENENLAKNLISLFAVKAFLRNSDEVTNQTASGLFGQDWLGVGSGGAVGLTAWKGRGGLQGSASVTQQKDAAVLPERFTQLTIPSRTHGVDYCETIVHDATAVAVDRHPRKLQWKVHPLEDEPEAASAEATPPPAASERTPPSSRGPRGRASAKDDDLDGEPEFTARR